jgi:hypothetical protein
MSEVTEVTDGTFVFREYIWLDGTVPTPRNCDLYHPSSGLLMAPAHSKHRQTTQRLS